MKMKLRLGDCYALANHKRKQTTIRYIGLLAVLTSMCLYAVKQVSAQTAEPAATAVADIEPLQIGDTIPEWLWHHPLQVVNHPDGKDTITLNDYRGKLIILDFMGLWCSSCIKALPKLAALQENHAGHLQIFITTEDSIRALAAFYNRNSAGKGLTLPAIAQDTVLRQYFPFRAVSHLVWITPDGLLATTTTTARADNHHVQYILAGKTPNWRPKIDELGFDYALPLFTPSDLPLDMSNPRSAVPLYSVLTGYLSGVQPKVVVMADSLTGITRRAFVNVSLYQLILYAVGSHPALLPDSQVVWAVHDRNRYRYEAGPGTYKTEWAQKNHYTYEVSFPSDDDAGQWRINLAKDLQRFFPGLHFSMKSDTLHIADTPQTFKLY